MPKIIQSYTNIGLYEHYVLIVRSLDEQLIQKGTKGGQKGSKWVKGGQKGPTSNLNSSKDLVR